MAKSTIYLAPRASKIACFQCNVKFARGCVPKPQPYGFQAGRRICRRCREEIGNMPNPGLDITQRN